jgi:hypothetical protein
LLVGVELGDSEQKQRLLNACLMTVKATDTFFNNVVNIFDSSNIRSDNMADDPDLGSPNRLCGASGGPGKGNGGKPGAAFPNCEAQGNIMIIQDENVHPSVPSDSRNGGCLDFTFTQSVSLVDFGIMDVDETDSVDIIMASSDNLELEAIESPSNIGDNGHWIASQTTDLSPYSNIKKMQVCFPASGAVTFIHFEACEQEASDIV